MSKKIIGHKKVLEKLDKQISSGRFSHANLFVGPKNIGKGAVAREIGKRLVCIGLNSCDICPDCKLYDSGNHPDILIVSKEDNIKIEDTRKIKEFASLKPFRAKRKIIILEQAESLTREAANSLLKLIEEPDGFSTFILTASNQKNVLETIVSRCQLSAFGLSKYEELSNYLEDIGVNGSEKETLIRRSAGKAGSLISLMEEEERTDQFDFIKLLSKGSYTDKFKLAEDFSKRGDLGEILNQFTLFFRDLLLLKNGIFDKIMYLNSKEEMTKKASVYKNQKIKEILESIKKIQEGLSQGLNTRLSLENLFILMEEK